MRGLSKSYWLLHEAYHLQWLQWRLLFVPNGLPRKLNGMLRSCGEFFRNVSIVAQASYQFEEKLLLWIFWSSLDIIRSTMKTSCFRMILCDKDFIGLTGWKDDNLEAISFHKLTILDYKPLWHKLLSPARARSKTCLTTWLTWLIIPHLNIVAWGIISLKWGITNHFLKKLLTSNTWRYHNFYLQLCSMSIKQGK